MNAYEWEHSFMRHGEDYVLLKPFPQYVKNLPEIIFVANTPSSYLTHLGASLITHEPRLEETARAVYAIDDKLSRGEEPLDALKDYPLRTAVFAYAAAYPFLPEARVSPLHYAYRRLTREEDAAQSEDGGRLIRLKHLPEASLSVFEEIFARLPAMRESMRALLKTRRTLETLIEDAEQGGLQLAHAALTLGDAYDRLIKNAEGFHAAALPTGFPSVNVTSEIIRGEFNRLRFTLTTISDHVLTAFKPHLTWWRKHIAGLGEQGRETYRLEVTRDYLLYMMDAFDTTFQDFPFTF